MDQTWFSSDGLMRLDPYPGDSQPNPYNNNQETVLNENGILYLGVYTYFTKYCPWFRDTYLNLEREPGLQCRLPKNYVRYEAQDNQMGAILGALSIGDQDIPNRINAYGAAHGYNFNNVEPGAWKLEQQRQGGDIAVMQIAADEQPEPWNLIWLIIGLLISTFKTQSASNDQQAWVRVQILILKNRLKLLTDFYMAKKGLTGVMGFYKPGHRILQVVQAVS
jgi:hypothetical protein